MHVKHVIVPSPGESEPKEQMRLGHGKPFFLFFRLHKEDGPQILTLQPGWADFYTLPISFLKYVTPVVSSNFGYETAARLISFLSSPPHVSMSPFREYGYGSFSNQESKHPIDMAGFSIGSIQTNPEFEPWEIKPHERKVYRVAWVNLKEINKANFRMDRFEWFQEILECFRGILLKYQNPSNREEYASFIRIVENAHARFFY